MKALSSGWKLHPNTEKLKDAILNIINVPYVKYVALIKQVASATIIHFNYIHSLIRYILRKNINISIWNKNKGQEKYKHFFFRFIFRT